MVKNEKTTGESCACKSSCCGKILPIATLVLLVPTLILSVMAYSKVSSLYKANVELQFGNETNLNKVYSVTQSAEYQKTVSEGVDRQIEQLKTSMQNAGTETQENTDSNTTSSAGALDTAAAYNDQLWLTNASEAETNFGLNGTPGNAIINVKTGQFKAIGGAYPQSAFEAAIAKLQSGDTTETDQEKDMGQSGTLSKEVLEKILAGAHYYGDANADIVVVEYSDILCPFCQRHYNAKTIENIVDASNGKVALVFKNMPIASLHPTAPLGAKGVECAGQIGGTQAYYDYLAQAFTYQVFNGSNVADIAKKIGLDEAQFAACFTK